MIWATFEPMSTEECFDFCEASYAFAMEWHDGQGSEIYRFFGSLSQLEFRVGPLFRGWESLTEQGKMYYFEWVHYYELTEEFNRQILIEERSR